jgi:hypothetical protein
MLSSMLVAIMSSQKSKDGLYSDIGILIDLSKGSLH